MSKYSYQINTQLVIFRLVFCQKLSMLNQSKNKILNIIEKFIIEYFLLKKLKAPSFFVSFHLTITHYSL